MKPGQGRLSRARPARRIGRARGWAGLFLLTSVATVRAADRTPLSFWKQIGENPLYEQVWRRLRLVDDEEARVVQALSVIGRYHGQYWNVNADEGSDSGWENRRLYFGLEARLWRQLTLHAQMKVSEDFDPFYDGLYQAFLEWGRREDFSLTLGRMDFVFAGLERSQSSNRIPAFERGLLPNQILPGEAVGAVAAGEQGKWSYHGGAFSGSIEQEFTDFAGGVAALAGAGHELPLLSAPGRLHLDWLYQDGNDANDAFEPYDHTLSLWHQSQAGRFGLGLDVTWAHGLDGRPDVLGLTVLPTWQAATNLLRRGDALVAVLRYQCAFSNGDDGLAPQPRYEAEVAPAGAGDRYHAVYGGLNYLVFGDRLKLMTGVEWAVLAGGAGDGGYNGWTWFSGVRCHF